MKTKIIIVLLVLALGLSLYVSFSAKDVEVKYIPKVITLSNTDTIYQEIEILTLKQDTIKLYYENKIHTYRILPTSKRVKLFSDRINRQ
tara:strand:+ start:219 stop:485 length:267 start_codon:yes stop_codon:yes gene_type:complete